MKTEWDFLNTAFAQILKYSLISIEDNPVRMENAESTVVLLSLWFQLPRSQL
jgi:hypothetical protein